MAHALTWLDVFTARPLRPRRARGHCAQQTGAGLQPIDVEVGTGAQASMLQEPATFGDGLDPAPVLAALGLATSDAHPGLGPQIVSTGLTQLIVPVREAAQARSFFLDGPSVVEDPATGSAAGPLMAYAHARTGVGRLAIDRGSRWAERAASCARPASGRGRR